MGTALNISCHFSYAISVLLQILTATYPSLCWEVSISFLRYFPDHLPNFSYKLRLLIDILTRKGNADLPAKRGIYSPEASL